MEAFLSTTLVYALLVWYGFWSWRQLQPLSSFRAQWPRLRPAVVRFALAWVVLIFGLNFVTQFACGASCDQQVRFWVTLLPFLPMHLGLFLLNLLVPPDIDYAMLIAICVFYGSQFVIALLLLVLISYAEWWILRLRSRRSAAA
jgi:hypothetical protein